MWKRKAGCGSAALQLAVPCGTRCWLPPWHLPFVLWLFMCCCCCCIQLCGDTAPLCPVSSIPPTGSVIKRFIREYCGRALDVRGRQARGGRRGPLLLSIVTGNGAPRTRRGGGASRSFWVFVLVFFSLQLLTCFNFIAGDAKDFSQADRPLSAA